VLARVARNRHLIEEPKSKDRPAPAKTEAPVIVARLKRAAVGSYATAADATHQRTLLSRD